MSHTAGSKCPTSCAPVALHHMGFCGRLELDNLAAFMRGAVEYKNKIGFKGALLLEPKPQASVQTVFCL